MSKAAPNTDWVGIPGHDKHSTVRRTRQVEHARVIHVTAASIRLALVAGHFEIAPTKGKPQNSYTPPCEVEVVCLWHGRKPPTSWMNLKLIGPCEVIENYSGTVVANIGRKAI